MKMIDFARRYLTAGRELADTGMRRLVTNPNMILPLRELVRADQALLGELSKDGVKALFGQGMFTFDVTRETAAKWDKPRDWTDLRGCTLFVHTKDGLVQNRYVPPLIDYRPDFVGEFVHSCDPGVFKNLLAELTKSFGRIRLNVQRGDQRAAVNASGTDVLYDSLATEAEDQQRDQQHFVTRWANTLSSVKAIATYSTAPFAVPDNAIVMNGARPLAGKLTGEGVPLFGRYYAAITPDTPNAGEVFQQNLRQGAGLVIFASREVTDLMAVLILPHQYRDDWGQLTAEQQAKRRQAGYLELTKGYYNRLNEVYREALAWVEKGETLPEPIPSPAPQPAAPTSPAVPLTGQRRGKYGSMIDPAIQGPTPDGLNAAELVVLIVSMALKSPFRRDAAMHDTGMSGKLYDATVAKLNAAGVYLQRSAITQRGRQVVEKFLDGKTNASSYLTSYWWDFTGITEATPATVAPAYDPASEPKRPETVIPPLLSEAIDAAVKADPRLAGEVQYWKTKTRIFKKDAKAIIDALSWTLNDYQGHTQDEFIRANVPLRLVPPAAIVAAIKDRPELDSWSHSHIGSLLQSADKMLTRWNRLVNHQ